MANEQNLVSLADRTTKEKREIGIKGGKASGESRRRRKTLKEELLLLLEQGDTQKNMTLSVLAKALDGDLKAYEIIRDTIGEKPKEQVEQKQDISITMNKDIDNWGK